MKKNIAIKTGKLVRKIARLKGGGSALPGLFMEKFYPNFVKESLSKLPHGVVVISGTNGKTTTTKMVVELLESQGLRVFTNKTGSNFVRGVAATLLESISSSGDFPADIAVLELDEAHATHFVKNIQPRFALLLNVMRDQLDRFGEIDYTAKLLQVLGEATSGVVVLNGDDKLLGCSEFSKDISAKVVRFGISDKLVDFFPNDDELHGAKSRKKLENSKYLLEDFSRTTAKINGASYSIQIGGIHNILNLTAALGLVEEIVEFEKLKFEKEEIEKAISNIRPAFGRGEVVKFGEKEIEIMLVKNPAGFRSNLKSSALEGSEVLIAINDNYADGRDMSWLWDVDFEVMKQAKSISVTGYRAYDMALRLFHDDIIFDEKKIDTNIKKSVAVFLAQDGKNKKIFATYTAMLEIRKEISKLTDVEKIL